MKSRIVVLVLVFAGLLFLFSGLSVFAGAEKPEWKLGDRWVFTYKNGVGLTGTFETAILGKVRQDGRPCWVIGLMLEIGDLRAEQHQYLAENFDLVGVETISSIGATSPTNGQLILLNPPMKNYCWSIEIGQKWNGSFQVVIEGFSQGDMNYETEVVGRETIVVPAGKFETFKIVETLITQQGNRYRTEKWYSLEAKNIVKEVSYLSNGNLDYIKELRDYRLR